MKFQRQVDNIHQPRNPIGPLLLSGTTALGLSQLGHCLRPLLEKCPKFDGQKLFIYIYIYLGDLNKILVKFFFHY